MDFEQGYVYELMEKGGPTDVRQPYFKGKCFKVGTLPLSN